MTRPVGLEGNGPNGREYRLYDMESGETIDGVMEVTLHAPANGTVTVTAKILIGKVDIRNLELKFSDYRYGDNGTYACPQCGTELEDEGSKSAYYRCNNCNKVHDRMRIEKNQGEHFKCEIDGCRLVHKLDTPFHVCPQCHKEYATSYLVNKLSKPPKYICNSHNEKVFLIPSTTLKESMICPKCAVIYMNEQLKAGTVGIIVP
ncbi:hypothetical protein LCGC14_1276390 [marine sediment metagenome]|uniref:Thaumarchaeal output domain-containing protein n=1 Tax=marine sediment metagenome TaxID=412755 RepID=A0A0F9KYA5_9ZZZZ